MEKMNINADLKHHHSRKLCFWEELISRNFASPPLYPTYLLSLVHPLLKPFFGRPCYGLTRIGWSLFRDCVVIQSSHYRTNGKSSKSLPHFVFCYCLLGKDLRMPGRFFSFLLCRRAGLLCLGDEFRFSIHDHQTNKSSKRYSFALSLSSIARLLLALTRAREWRSELRARKGKGNLPPTPLATQLL